MTQKTKSKHAWQVRSCDEDDAMLDDIRIARRPVLSRSAMLRELVRREHAALMKRRERK
jgi:hypothetical protein